MKKEKEVFRGGCLHCPGTADELPMDEVLYQGFGGYVVSRNGEIFYSGNPQGEWLDFKTLGEIEETAKKHQNDKWKVELSNPLRGATWERNKEGKWILIETNQGFA